MDVVNILNIIGNNYAISTSDLAESLTRSSASLVAAGNSLEQAAALTVAGNTILQDPEGVGNALKVVAMRIRGTASELEAAGEETDGLIESSSKLQAKILALSGVNILNDDGSYKDTYTILYEIGKVYDNLSDLQQADLLETIAGKTRGSAVAAILQNYELLEDAYETSLDADGSAAKELETYLDSIQGKIDQFTNAVQVMWNHIFDSSLVKGVVDLGTELIKIVDQISLLGTALLALGAYKGFKVVFDVFRESGVSVDFLTKKLGSYLLGINTVTASETTLTQAQVARKLAQQGLTDKQAQAIATQEGLATSTANLSRETLIASLQAQGYTAEEAELIATKVFGTQVTNASTGSLITETIQRKLATSGLIQYGIQQKIVTAEQVAGASITGLLGLSFKVLTTAIRKATVAMVKFLLTNPVGWAILAVSALAVGIALFAHFHKTTEELTEELDDLKIGLQDIQSEIDSLNDELETTEERMAELLAKDTLTFVEEEELERLRKQNDELQRKIDLQKTLADSKRKETEKTFKETMESKMGQKYMKDNNNGLVGTFTKEANGWYEFWGVDTVSGEKALQSNIDVFQEKIDANQKVQEEAIEAQKLLDSGEGSWIDRLAAKLEISAFEMNSESLSNLRTSITAQLEEYKESIEGIEYGDDPEVNAYLDYVNNMLDRWAIKQGGENAKTNAITRIFNKDENAATFDSINNYVEALSNGDSSAESSIENIITNNAALVEDLEACGLSIGKAVEYFTSLASEQKFNTVEGKMKEVEEAASRLSTALSGDFNTSSFEDLDKIKQALSNQGWVDADGNLLSDAIAEYFGGEDGGISEETRAEIERLVKQIYDGKITVQDALKEFELFSVQSTLDIYVGEIQTNFKDVFVDLEEADGLINTFEELGEAIGSAAGALETFNQAEAEMAYSGQVSIETALKLMEYTDDYGSVLTVVDGKLQLAEGAEEALIETRLASIKTSAEAALQDAQLASEKAWLAVEEYKSAMQTEVSTTVVSAAWDQVLAKAAGFAAGIQSLFTSESWSEAYDKAYSEAISKVAEKQQETKYTDDGLQALVDAAEESDKKLKVAKSNNELAQNLTLDNLKGVFSSNEASGGTSSEEDAEEKKAADGWEALLSKYENELALITNERDLIQAEIDNMEAQGGKASAKYYEDLIRNSNEEQELLAQKLVALQEYLNANKDAIDQDTWTDYNNEINETAVAIKECTKNTLEWEEALREVDKHYFDQATDEISRLGEELEFINGLLEDEDVADENGNWSSAALTRLGMYTNQLELAAAEAARYGERIDELNEQRASGELSEEQYQEALSEAISEQQNAIQSYEDAKDSIVELNEARIDAVKEGIEQEISAYEDLISLKKKELEAERD